MIRSLRFKLLLMTVSISVVAVVTIALLSSRTTKVELRHFVDAVGQTDLQRVRDLLTEQYRRQGDWKDASLTLEQVGKITGKHFLLLHSDGNLLATYPADLASADLAVAPNGELTVRQRRGGDGQQEIAVMEVALGRTPNLAIRDTGGAIVAWLYPLPVLSPEEAGKREAFFASVNRSMVVAVAGVVAVALLAAFAFSRFILRPVESLTQAVRAMEKGTLTERVDVRSENEIGELASAFNAMADSLSRLEQLRRNMVSDIAHELRTPLTNLRCQIEALQDGLTAPSTDVFNSLHEETMLLNRLLDDLQDLALAEAGQLRLEREPVSVARVIKQSAAAFAAQAESGGLALKIDLPADLPAVYADQERVGQILRNLLANALAHTPRGGAIEVGAQLAGKNVEIIVSNTGAGIAPEHLPNIFERFYRADSSRARATGGAGLGLAIVKQLVEAQGGRVRAESPPGRGPSFSILLPVYKSIESRES